MTEATEQRDERSSRVGLRSALATVAPLVTMSRDGLVLVALAWEIDRPPAYETATAATARGDLELRELGGGTVPTIEAATKEWPVVIFAGDTIVGGRQNRIINVSIWLKAATVTPIPVSCLEAGRWDTGSRFEPGRKVDYLLRSRISRQVEERARYEHGMLSDEGAPPAARRASYAADQSAIWNRSPRSTPGPRSTRRRPPSMTSTSARRPPSPRSSPRSPARPGRPGSPSRSADTSSRLSCSTRPRRSPSSGRGSSRAPCRRTSTIAARWSPVLSRLHTIAIPTRVRSVGCSRGHGTRSTAPSSARRSARGSTSASAATRFVAARSSSLGGRSTSSYSGPRGEWWISSSSSSCSSSSPAASHS